MRDTEKKIRDYYAELRRLGSIKHSIKTKENSVKVLEDRLINNGYRIPIEYKGTSFGSENVQTSRNIKSPQEKGLDNILLEIEKEIRDLKRQIMKDGAEIESIKSRTSQMWYIINSILSEESRKIVKMSYKENRSTAYIAEKLNLDKSNISRKKKNILSSIENYCATNSQQNRNSES